MTKHHSFKKEIAKSDNLQVHNKTYIDSFNILDKKMLKEKVQNETWLHIQETNDVDSRTDLFLEKLNIIVKLEKN